MKKLVYLLLLVFVATPIFAESSLEDADNAYMQEHYQEAAEIYEAALNEGTNVDVYYNLGNTYYRLKDMGKAILYYERALRLAPDNEDIKYNLELCQSKIVDQFNKPSEMFFITWLKDFTSSKNSNQWGYIGIVCILFSVILFGIYRFSSRVGVRKFSFFVSLGLFLISILVNFAAAWTYYQYSHDSRAVIMSEVSLYKASNDKEEPIRALNAGTTVNVLQENSKGWWEVTLPSGKKGWIEEGSAIKIKE